MASAAPPNAASSGAAGVAGAAGAAAAAVIDPQAAGEDRVWKNLCHQRWRRVNIRVDRNSKDGGKGGHQAAYASLNGWRDPRLRLRRTILCTAPGSHSVSVVAFDQKMYGCSS